MKQISLIKKSPFADEHLVNVYHSLYSIALRNTLREKGLFLFTDYIYEYKVYEHKIIWITVTLLTNKANRLTLDLANITLDLSESTVTTCIKSLSANTQQSYSFEFAKIVKALEKLDDQQWENYDFLELLDIQALTAPRTHLIHANETLAVKQYVSGFRLNPEYLAKNPNNILIFAHALDLILIECANVLTATLGGSLKQKKNIYNRDQALLTRTHCFTEKLELKEIGKVLEGAYTDVIQKGILESIIEYAKQDFRMFPDCAIIPQQVYESSYYIAGYKGWRHLITLESLTEVLNHTELRVSDLNREISAPLKDIHNEQGLLQR